MREIDDFIENYNRYLELKRNTFPDVVLIEKVGTTSFDNPLEYFFKNFKFPKQYNYSGFVFPQKSVKIGTRYVFASHIDYTLDYIYDNNDGVVALWDYETEDIEWYCALNILTFFEAMSIVINSKSLMIERKTFELDETYLKSLFDKCMNLNDNKIEFEQFYIHILGLD